MPNIHGVSISAGGRDTVRPRHRAGGGGANSAGDGGGVGGGIDALSLGGGSIRGLPVLIPRGAGSVGSTTRRTKLRGNSAESLNVREREDKENVAAGTSLGGPGLAQQQAPVPVAARFPASRCD